MPSLPRGLSGDVEHGGDLGPALAVSTSGRDRDQLGSFEETANQVNVDQ
jgi:hypothetical protein